MKTPIEFADVRDLGMRATYPVNIVFDYWPPNANGRKSKFKDFRRMKEHVFFTASILPVLDTHELFKILQGIDKGQVHEFWRDIVYYLWCLKTSNRFSDQILLDDNKLKLRFGDGEADLPLIEYPETARFVNKYE